MKSFKNLSLLAFMLVFLGSCNNDFLERDPLDQLSLGTFFQSENDLLVYNNSFYDQSLDDHQTSVLHGHSERFLSGFASYWFVDGSTDNAAPNWGRYNEIRSGRDFADGREYFGYTKWDFLRTINIGLANYDRAKIDQRIIDKYAAEARFFRAWFYWDKVSKFGDVQYIDTELELNDPKLFGERDDRDFVMGKVLEDIEFAETNLPEDWGDKQDPGRIDRWCALALKARLCLFEGTWKKYRGEDGSVWLEKSAAAAKQLMEEGGFELYQSGDSSTTYNEPFREYSGLEGNKEIIYWIKYQDGVRTNNVVNYYPDRSGGATKSMVEDYLCTDGLPISLSDQYAGDAKIEDVFVNRDPRLRQTVLHPDDQGFYEYAQRDSKKYPRLQGMGGVTSTTGYHIIKQYNVNTALRGFNQSTTPAIAFRLGETLLIYAEAMAELGRITQADLDVSINLLRDRVSMPHLMMDPPMDPRYADVGISSLLVEIRRERRVELFAEAQRHDDIRRWKTGKTLEVADLGMRFDEAAVARYVDANVQTTLVDGIPYIAPFKGTSFENPVFEEPKNYLWPIPASDISANPALGQNPGYE